MLTNLAVGLLLELMTTHPLSLIEQGDQEFARIRYQQAVDLYISALSASSDSADVLWRLARVYVCQADIAPQHTCGTGSLRL